MSAVTFDTLKFTRRLKDAGVPERQAEAEAEAIKEAFGEALETQLATKTDVHRLERGQDRLKSEIQEVKAEQRLMKWMLGFNLAFTLAIFWKMFVS